MSTLIVDVAAGAARVDGHLLKLTPAEFALLRALASVPDRVHPHEKLLADLASFGLDDERHLSFLACRLRSRLHAVGLPALYSYWGVGYRLRCEEASFISAPCAPLG